MVLPPDHAVRLLRAGPGVPQLGLLDWTRARVLKTTDSGSVLSLALPRADADEGGTDSKRVVIAKSMSLALPRDRAKAALRAHRLWRQWRGSERLAGIAPTAPLIALYRGVRTSLPVLTLLMERVAGPTLLEQLANNHNSNHNNNRNNERANQSADEKADDLAQPVGELLGTLVRHHLFNRDPKPSNLIVAPGGLTMIDTVAIRWTIRPVHALARMLAALVLEPTGVGCPPARDWLVRAVASAVGRAQLRCEPPSMLARIDAIVERHGDPTPSDNPLSTMDGPALRD